MDDALDTLDALRRAADAGHPAVMVTVIAVDGQVPSRPGAKVVVSQDSVRAGTLGCSEFDSAATDLAGELLAGARTTVRRRAVFGHGQVRALDLFAEVFSPAPLVAVVGDTPVGRAVSDLATFLGRRAALIDGSPAARLGTLRLTGADAVVVSDHDAPYVEEVLRIALAGQAGFVGMLGSRQHAPEVVRRLRERGVAAGHLARLRSPVGLDIGGRAPREIALSVLAEVVATTNGRTGGRMAAPPDDAPSPAQAPYW